MSDNNLFVIDGRSLKIFLINTTPFMINSFKTLIKDYGGELVADAAESDLVISHCDEILSHQVFINYPKIYKFKLIQDTIDNKQLVDFENYRISEPPKEKKIMVSQQIESLNTETGENSTESVEKINEKENDQVLAVAEKSKRKNDSFETRPPEMFSLKKSQKSIIESSDDSIQIPLKRPKLDVIHFENQNSDNSIMDESQKKDEQINGGQNNLNVPKDSPDDESATEKNQKKENNNKQNKRMNIEPININQVILSESSSGTGSSQNSDGLMDIAIIEDSESESSPRDFSESQNKTQLDADSSVVSCIGNSKKKRVVDSLSQSVETSSLSSTSSSPNLLRNPFHHVSSPQLLLSQDILQSRERNYNNSSNKKSDTNNRGDEENKSGNNSEKENESDNNTTANSIDSDPDIKFIAEVPRCRTPENVLVIDLEEETPKYTEVLQPPFHLDKKHLDANSFTDNQPLIKTEATRKPYVQINEQDIDDFENNILKITQSKPKKLLAKRTSNQNDHEIADIRFKGFLMESKVPNENVFTSTKNHNSKSRPKHLSSDTSQISKPGQRCGKTMEKSSKLPVEKSTEKAEVSPNIEPVEDKVVVPNNDDDDDKNVENNQGNNQQHQEKEKKKNTAEKSYEFELKPLSPPPPRITVDLNNPNQHLVPKLEDVVWNKKFVNHPYVRKYDRFALRYQEPHYELKKKPFMIWEQQAMLWYLIKKNGFVTGYHNSTFWTGMIRDGFLLHRSGDSILNHFQRTIMKNLSRYQLPPEIHSLF